jgi:hypothetical protein
MGGGSSSSSAQNVHNDNDIMASDSAVVIGANGSYTDASKEVGMGGKLLESGSVDMSGNEGLIFGEGTDYNSNSGIQIGEGGSLITSSMDERTAGLLDNAMTYMYANTENILELAAQQGGGKDPTFMNPEKTTLPTKEAGTKLSPGWTLGLAGVGALMLSLLFVNGETP